MTSNASITRFDSLESTNRYCEVLDLDRVKDFSCFWALAQTAGIGQRGNHWAAEPGRNLTFSLVLHPTFLPADQQFRLTQALSLAVLDFLKVFKGLNDLKDIKDIKFPKNFKGFEDLNIKWPNDIYVGCKKICGILVNTRISATRIASAICGIGLNVNQREYPDWVPNPTSLSLLTGREHPLEETLHQLLNSIEKRYRQLQDGHNFDDEYHAHLLNLGRPARYRYQGHDITATITGTDPFGRLLLTSPEAGQLCCGMKEISLLP